MKNKFLLFLVGFALAFSANAEMTKSGYIDFALTDTDAANGTGTAVAEFELALDFAEVDSPWSATVELTFDGVSDGTDGGNAMAAGGVALETATISYAASDALSFTFGNMLSYAGFESFDATGLYQFSYADLAGDGVQVYAVGGSVDYDGGDFSVGYWVGNGNGDIATELGIGYTGIEGLTLYYATDNADISDVWGLYEAGDATFAVESYKDGAEEYLMGLFYYAMGDAGVTFRYTDGEDGVDYSKFTVSPSYAFSDSVFGLVELSQIDATGAEKVTEFAAELIYSF